MGPRPDDRRPSGDVLVEAAQAWAWNGGLGMPVRASVAKMLGALIVVGVIWLGGTALSPPKVTVLRAAPTVSSPTPKPSPVAAASPVVASRLRVVRVVD